MYVVYLLRTLKVLVYSLSINIEDTLNNKHFEPVLVLCAADFFLQLGSCKEAVR